MKARDADILVLPGLGGGDPDTWYYRWMPRLRSARKVEQPDFWKPDLEIWRGNVLAAISQTERPIILIGHSAGVLTAVHAAAHAPLGRIGGAFLVAPPDIDACMPDYPQIAALGPAPDAALPFPSIVVASRNDPFCAFAEAEGFAKTWHARLIDAGEAGHLNAESGHGPWPEGSLAFARFVASL